MAKLPFILAAAGGLMLVLACGMQAVRGEPSPASRPASRSASAAATQPALKLPAMWEMSAPVLAPENRDKDRSVSQKDPTIIFDKGRWHLFMTIKTPDFTPIEYASFAKWEEANAAQRTILRVYDGKYYCAPQAFYFRPHKKWYLVYQAGVPSRKFMHVAYSITETIADANSWTKVQWFFPDESADPRKEGGLDYWVICDAERAYLFFTSLNGKLWRCSTALADFPRGWGDCKVALQADIFEASHTYRLKGTDQFLTIVEANPGGKRYYKAYLADRLDGEWRALADTEQKPFAGAANVRAAAGVPRWADNISHGELLRDGTDETMTVDPANLRFLFQGATEAEKSKAGGYGKIPWRLGILTPGKTRDGP